MNKKDDEKKICKIFITEYNRQFGADIA